MGCSGSKKKGASVPSASPGPVSDSGSSSTSGKLSFQEQIVTTPPVYDETIIRGMDWDPVELEFAVGDPFADGDVPVLVSMKPVEGTGRTPCDIVCVIDVSWSMTLEAKVVGAKAESTRLSMLDVAKHAVRSVIHTLGPEDRFSMIRFCRQSTVVLPLTSMTPEAKYAANTKLDNIQYGNGTRLWTGLHLALQQLKEAQGPPRIGHIMVLTDGETESKEEVMENLKKEKENCGRLPGTISCLGFGYEIDSPLLTEVATYCDGTYAFIPDAGLMGTILVNTVSNLLVTVARDVTLTLKRVDGGSAPTLVTAGFENTEMPDGSTKIEVGTLQFGQSKDIVVKTSGGNNTDAPLEASLTYTTAPWEKSRSKHCSAAVSKGSKDTDIEVHIQRSLFLEDLQNAIYKAQHDVNGACEDINERGRKVAESAHAGEAALKGLLEDIQGQVGEAFASKEYWEKWGRHYVPSIMFAHRLQQCNNFKDPGVQLYGGDVFNDVRDLADEAFNKLRAPEVTPAQFHYLGGGQPCIVNENYRNGGGVQPDRRQGETVNMAVYNDRYAACIDGVAMVELASGEPKHVAELAKGDLVTSRAGAEAEVICVVQTRCNEGVASLVQLLGGPRLTPYHPVHVSGQWRFPAELGDVDEYPCEAVYSVVLRGAPDLLVDGVPCVALGHGLQEGAALHPYFGSELVLEDLARSPGFSKGFVELRPEGTQRDPDTGLVCALEPLDCCRHAEA